MSLVFNNYDDSVADPVTFKQLVVKDALFLYYKCPQLDKQLQLFSHYNEIMFTLEGGRIMRHGGKSWTLSQHSCILTRKTAYLQELPETTEWSVLAFYFQDSFFRQVIKEYRQYLPFHTLPSPPSDMLMDVHINETTLAFFYSILPYVAATKVVHHFMQKSKSDDFKDFILEFPRLKNNFSDLIRCHYKMDIFISEKAKREFVEPDLLPFD